MYLIQAIESLSIETDYGLNTAKYMHHMPHLVHCFRGLLLALVHILKAPWQLKDSDQTENTQNLEQNVFFFCSVMHPVSLCM